VSAAPAAGTRLCALADLEDRGTRGFHFRQGDAIFAGFVVRLGDRVVGYVDACPHAGWPLEGLPDRYLTREKDFILCSGHGALFRPEDGVCVAGPCGGAALTAWPVRVEGGEVVTA
jgi:nitrite reductase/ring-hydroxylating ferredoxin subunit